MKNLLRSALVLCAIVAVNAQAACSKKLGCGKRPVARYAVANRSGFKTRTNKPKVQHPVVRGGCANGSCSL
jgi:hypothetical protein